MDLDTCQSCKLPIVGSNRLCILNSEWNKDCVKLLLLHDNQAWRGEFQITDNEDLAELIDQLSLTKEKFIAETKQALTAHGGAECFTYFIQNEKFQWKKCLGKNIVVKFGFVSLEKIQVFEAFEEVLDKTLQENIILKEQLKISVQKNESFSKENQLLEIKINDLTLNKEKMEDSLYGQFLYLLNEKKKRISELQKKLDPHIEDELELGTNQSDNDPYGSDTEIDSEEDENLTEKLKSEGSLEVKKGKVPSPLKRLKKTEIPLSVAGPSGCQKGKTVASPTKPVPRPGRKPSNKVKEKKNEKFSCIMGNLADEKDKSNSEEEAFMFPKRLKRVTNGVKLVKPSTSKIYYESDDDDDPTTITDGVPQVTEPEVPSTSKAQGPELNNCGNTSDKDSEDNVSKLRNIEENSSASNSNKSKATSDECVSKIELDSKEENQNQYQKERSETPTRSFSGFSTSTLDILNRLI